MAKDIHDLVIIGAGPSALTAAVYSSREDIKTLLFEKATVGGLAATTDRIDNYPGFPDGVAGYEIANKMQKQAEKFGSIIKSGEVTQIVDRGDTKVVIVGGKPVVSRAILIATGSSYRKLGVKGELENYGRGVHYCATCDGAFYKGRKVAVVGGGNSAIQEAIFLTKFTEHIDIISLSDITASQLLKKELIKYIDDGKITVHKNTKTIEIISNDGKVSSISVEKNGKLVNIKTDGVFIFVGLKPNTQFLVGSKIKLDECNFVVTDGRLQTNIPGIFASGDVRSGATMQVASAVGEGVTAAIGISEYLAK